MNGHSAMFTFIIDFHLQFLSQRGAAAGGHHQTLPLARTGSRPRVRGGLRGGQGGCRGRGRVRHVNIFA